VHRAGDEVEAAVFADRAGGHTQLAFKAWRVVQRLAVAADRRVEQDRGQQDEVAELRVNDVAVDTHYPHPGRDRHRLVRYHPDPAREVVHLDREGRRRVQRAMSGVLQAAHDLVRGLVDDLAAAVELLIGDAAAVERTLSRFIRTTSEMKLLARDRTFFTIGCSSSLAGS
jgi:hypothetical protein